MNDDWRLEAYKGELNGKIFELKKFVSSKGNDHEHCEFCYRKITDLNTKEEHDAVGYVLYNEKTRQNNWVCESCFNEFKNQFNFQVKYPS